VATAAGNALYPAFKNLRSLNPSVTDAMTDMVSRNMDNLSEPYADLFHSQMEKLPVSEALKMMGTPVGPVPGADAPPEPIPADSLRGQFMQATSGINPLMAGAGIGGAGLLGYYLANKAKEREERRRGLDEERELVSRGLPAM
jgi:hypothetical protein